MYDPHLLLPRPQHTERDPQRAVPLESTYPVALVLALALSGITVCIFCAPFAWNMASTTLRRMQDDSVPKGWELVLVEVARYLGIIGTAVLVVGICLFIFLRVL